MAETILVERDIAEGNGILQRLDDVGLPVSMCVWLNSQQAESWRFVLATPAADSYGLRAVYATVIHALAPQNGCVDLSAVEAFVQRDRDRLPQLLRRVSATFSIAERWLTGYAIDGVTLEDVYVYRSCRAVHAYRGYTLTEEILPSADPSHRLRFRASGSLEPARRQGVSLLASRNGEPAFTRTLAITDEAAGQQRLLDRAGPQPRLWAFLTTRGLTYTKRVIDLVLDRHVTAVIPERELVLTGEMADFPFAAQADAALLEAEFASPSRV